MIIQLKAPKKTRYIITIAEDETPAWAYKELTVGIITAIITARTPAEAEEIRKECDAVIRTAVTA